MKAFEIQDVKTFMGRLFGESFFDGLMVSFFELTTGMHVRFDGKRNVGWYSDDEMEVMGDAHIQGYVCWREMKPHVFDLIRGKRTPVSMDGAFILPEPVMRQVLQAYGLEQQNDLVETLVWNLHFEKGSLRLVTGCSLRTFSLDKSVEQAWDAWTGQTLRQQGIACEVVS